MQAIAGTCKVPLRVQIERGELAPSKVNQGDLLSVSEIILAQSFGPSMSQLKDLIVGLQEIDTKQPDTDTEQLPDTHVESIEQLTVFLNKQSSTTGYLFTDEAASYIMLGVVCVHFADTLKLVYKKQYTYVNQFHVTKLDHLHIRIHL